MRRLLSILAVLVAFVRVPSAQESLVILGNSQNPATAKRVLQIKGFLKKLCSLNQLDEGLLGPTTVDLSEPAAAETWRKFSLSVQDAPGICYVHRRGNRVQTVLTSLVHVKDPVEASQVIFRYLQGKGLPISVTELPTGLSISSRPPGASIYVDGHEVGKTPMTDIPVPTGKPVTVILKHGDADDWQKTYTLTPGSSQTVEVELRRLDGLAMIECDTPAQVYLDGSPTSSGTTPFQARGLKVGAHLVRLAAAGYSDTKFNLNVTGNKLTRARCALVTERPRIGYRIRSSWSQNDEQNVGFEITKVILSDSRFSAVQGDSNADLVIQAVFPGGNEATTFSLLDRRDTILASEQAGGNAGEAIRTLVPRLLSKISATELKRLQANIKGPEPDITVEELPQR